MHCDFLFCGRTGMEYDPGREEKDFFLRRAFSRKAKDAPRQGRSIYIFLHSPGALSRSPTMKSEGLVPMEIPLGLIPRLMTKGKSAWRKATKKGPDTSTRGATCWFTKPRPSVTRSPGPKGSSAQLPTPPGIALSEPSQEWPLVDTHHFSPVREALFNTLRKDVHRGQKDSVIGT
ncbi:hypothetical protein Patl1_37432 [Pistacia atlantica]|nr:hypothetical protein Patl1_37432 [Pistacia atlantica]